MRIAIPTRAEQVFSPLGSAEGFRFYEDDHGKIVNRFFVPLEAAGTETAVALLERYGIDALVCGAVSDDERGELASAGIMLFPNASGSADDAALGFLSGAIAFDPANTCNACGHGHSCSMACGSCKLSQK